MSFACTKVIKWHEPLAVNVNNLLGGFALGYPLGGAVPKPLAPGPACPRPCGEVICSRPECSRPVHPVAKGWVEKIRKINSMIIKFDISGSSF